MTDLIISLMLDPGFAIGYLGAASNHMQEVAGAL